MKVVKLAIWVSVPGCRSLASYTSLRNCQNCFHNQSECYVTINSKTHTRGANKSDHEMTKENDRNHGSS